MSMHVARYSLTIGVLVRDSIKSAVAVGAAKRGVDVKLTEGSGFLERELVWTFSHPEKHTLEDFIISVRQYVARLRAALL